MEPVDFSKIEPPKNNNKNDKNPDEDHTFYFCESPRVNPGPCPNFEYTEYKEEEIKLNYKTTIYLNKN